MKVIVRRAGSGIAAASSLLVAAGGTAGCIAEDVDPGGQEETAEASDAITGGSARLSAGGWPGDVSLTVTGSTTDEYVRVTEVLTVGVPPYILWDAIHPDQPMPDDVACIQQLASTVTVTYLDQGQVAGSQALSTSWSGNQLYTLEAVSAQFTVPAGVDGLRFSIAITDAGSPGSTGAIGSNAIDEIPVFGGELPDKTALFDSSNSTVQTRILEGDALVKGAEVTLGYTDWRADVLADRSTINAQIGVREGWGRFGYYTMPIYGNVVHEVQVGYYFDDGGGWRQEQPLAASTTSRLLPAGRTAFEKTLAIPGNATILSMYFHVKSYVVADYAPYASYTVQAWYPQGSHTLVREKWDNPYGAYSNHDFWLQNP